jgi:hypothetical protein
MVFNFQRNCNYRGFLGSSAESKPDQKELMISLVEHFILLKDE